MVLRCYTVRYFCEGETLTTETHKYTMRRLIIIKKKSNFMLSCFHQTQPEGWSTKRRAVTVGSWLKLQVSRWTHIQLINNRSFPLKLLSFPRKAWHVDLWRQNKETQREFVHFFQFATALWKRFVRIQTARFHRARARHIPCAALPSELINGCSSQCLKPHQKHHGPVQRSETEDTQLFSVLSRKSDTENPDRFSK